jgi:hypothetical protein
MARLRKTGTGDDGVDDAGEDMAGRKEAGTLPVDASGHPAHGDQSAQLPSASPSTCLGRKIMVWT